MRRALLLVFVLAFGTGCYRATVLTGRPASGEKITKPWASSWIAGLVPPSTVETAARCPSGVARVETQHSFLNMLVHMVTFGIYSPMTIEVDCAAAGSAGADALTVPAEASREVVARVLEAAVQRSAATEQGVFVRFE